MTDLWNSVPPSIKSDNYPIEVVHIQQPHIKALQALNGDPNGPLRWFGVDRVEDFLQLVDIVVCTFLVRKQVAGFIYLETSNRVLPTELEIGYCLLEPYRGRGVLELALFTILGELFGIPLPNEQKLEAVRAFVDRENIPSSKAHQRMGLERLPSKNRSYESYRLSAEGWDATASKLEALGRLRFGE